MRPRSLASTATDTLAEPRGSVDSLRRGLEILSVFRPGEDALAAIEISARMGLPRATTQRLIQTLCACGFLRQLERTDRYFPGEGCRSLGNAVILDDPYASAGRAVLPVFARRASASTALMAREGMTMLCLAAAQGAAYPAPKRVGAALPLDTSAVGHAWLWAQMSSVQSAVIQRIRENLVAQDAANMMASIYRSFESLERNGYCTAVQASPPDRHAFATPINVGGVCICALGCEIDGQRADIATRTEVGAMLLDAAHSIATRV